MTVKINYSNKSKDNAKASTVLFVDDKFNTKILKKFLANNELNYINDLLKNSDLKKNLFVYELNSKKKNCLNINQKKS